MADSKKKSLMLAIMLGKGKPKGVSDSKPDDGDDSEDGDDMDLGKEGLTSAMKDFHAAFHAADFEAMGEAFKDACSLCDDDGQEDEDSDEEDGPSLGGAYGRK